MVKVDEAHRLVRFRHWVLDLSSAELVDGDTRVQLPEQPFQLLAALLERPGVVISRDDLQRRLWPDTHVDFEHGLNAAVRRLRDALGDTAEQPQFIETVPRRGYRFVAPVEPLSPVPAGDTVAVPPDVPAPTPTGAAPADATRGVWRRPLAGLVGVALLAGAAWFLVEGSRPNAPRVGTAPLRLMLDAPRELTDWIALSPDGQAIAAVMLRGPEHAGSGATAPPWLWVRGLNEQTWRAVAPVSAVPDQVSCTWTPDGRGILVARRDGLERIDVPSGRATRVSGLDARGTSWAGDVILLGGATLRALREGVVTPALTSAAASVSEQVWPAFAPDGRHFVFTQRSADATATGLYVATLGDAAPVRLVPHATTGLFAGPDRLVFADARGRLVVQAVDLRARALVGQARVIAPAVSARDGHLAVATSANGTIVWRPLAPQQPLSVPVWLDRNGRPLARLGPPRPYRQLALGPEDIAVLEVAGDTGPELLLLDARRGTTTRVPTVAGTMGYLDPAWSPDGRSLAVVALRPQALAIALVPVSGAATMRALATEGFPEQFSPDGRHLLAPRADSRGTALYAVDLATAKSRRLTAAEPARFDGGQWSPDMSLIAYESDESGEFAVYVERVAGDRPRQRVSTDAAQQPVWRRDGRELFTIGRDGSLRATPVGADGRLGATRALFFAGLRGDATLRQFGASHDGRQFLVLLPADGAPRAELMVLVEAASAPGPGATSP